MSEKLPRVFYLITSLNIGGTEKFLATLIERLQPSYDFTVGYLKEKGTLGRQLESKGIEVVRVSPYTLFRRLGAGGYDLLHTFLYRANVVGRIIAKLAGVPAVISSQQAIDAWKKPHHVWLERATARWCNRIIANSSATKTILETREKIEPDKISVVYNGLNHETFLPKQPAAAIRKRFGIDENVALIASVTRLHPEKGTDLLPLIAQRMERGAFLVIGDGPQRGELEAQVRRLNLQNRFFFTGWQDDVAGLLAASDFYLLPSREESFPQVILEAMAMGLAVVAADVGGVRELVEDGITGALVPPQDVEGFSTALTRLVSNQALARQMGTAGRGKSLQFTETRMVREIAQIYERSIHVSTD